MREEDVQRIRAQVRALQRRLRRESQGGSLSRTALQLLAAVERSAEPMTPGQLATALQMTSSNVAATLRELDAAAAVRRRRDERDGRRVFVELTPVGRAQLAEYRHGKDAWLGKAIDEVLDEDEKRILLHAADLLQRLAESDVTA